MIRLRDIALFAGVLIVAGAGGFASHHWLEGRRQAVPAAPSPGLSVADQMPSYEAPPPPPAAARPQIPDVLPEVALPDAAGRQHHFSEWQGRLVALNFWATWCEPCQREIPLLKRLQAERRAQGLEVVGIAVDLRAAVVKYAHDAQIDYPLLMGEKDGLAALTALGMDTVFPFTVFADRKGRIVALKVGELQADDARLILDRLHDLDDGHLSLPDARRQIADGLAALAVQHAQAPR